MDLKQQIINDIDVLPEPTLRAISMVVKEFILLTTKPEPAARPVYGSCNGKMWFADDFDAPLEELREYME